MSVKLMDNNRHNNNTYSRPVSSTGGSSGEKDWEKAARENIERAARSGVSYIAQPGGSIRDDNVIDACNKHGMVMAMTKMRLFHH